MTEKQIAKHALLVYKRICAEVLAATKAGKVTWNDTVGRRGRK